jgi:hypothetical protein
VDGVPFGNEHDPKIVSQMMLVQAHKFPQTTPNTIASNRATEMTRRNKPYAARARIVYGYDTKQ